ncbi:MAG TPA: hypothetical protein VFJ05_07035 [Nitrososphaeraceae archaeon]|nr:hypothetical protein [Nitrososphaeraceae archaeon]
MTIQDDSPDSNTNTNTDTKPNPKILALEERRRIIDYVTAEYGLDLIPVNTADKADDSKRGSMFKANKTDILSTAISTGTYLSNIESGKYDNGLAVICGRIRRSLLKGHRFGIVDLDKKKGVDEILTHYFDCKNIDELADKIYIEWNGVDTDERFHIPFITAEPDPDTEIAAKGADTVVGIEINVNGVAFGFGSPHHKGGFYQQRGKADLSKIWRPSQNEILVFQNAVMSICDRNGVRYFTKERPLTGKNKNKEITETEQHKYNITEQKKFYNSYNTYLEDLTTVINKGERHQVIKDRAISYFNKYQGEWKDLADDERLARLIEYDKLHCKPVSLYEESPREFTDIWEWVKRTFTGIRQEERDKREDVDRRVKEKYKEALDGVSEDKQKAFKGYNQQVQNYLSGNVWCEISKDCWIVSDRKENIIYRCELKTVGRGDFQFTAFHKDDRLLKCIPVSITKHEDPFDITTTTYTITFLNTLHKAYTQARLSIDEIAEWLKNEGYSLPSGNKGGTTSQIICAMIDAFREDGKLKIERSAHFEGYYFDIELNDLVINKINLAEKHPRRTKEECVLCADFLEKRSKFSIYTYKDKKDKPIDRRDVLATCIKWTVIAPFNFLLKQIIGKYLNAISHAGERDGGKSSMSFEMLDIHGHRLDKRLGDQSIYAIDAGSANTEAKFGKAVDKSTYPTVISEFGNIESYGRNEGLAETIKNGIESTNCRKGKKGSRFDAPFAAATSIIFNGNPVISFKGELLKRIHSIKYSQEDRHDIDDPNTIKFNEFMDKRRHEYKILGDWVINYLIDNKAELLLSGKYDQYKLMDMVIKAFYDNIGQQVPEWMTRWIEDNSLEELDVDESSIIRAVLHRHIHDVLRQSSNLISKFDNESAPVSLEERIKRCLENNLLSFARCVSVVVDSNGKNDVNTSSYEIDTSIKMIFKDHLSNITLKKIAEKMGFEYTKGLQGTQVIRFTGKELTDFILNANSNPSDKDPKAGAEGAGAKGTETGKPT